MRLLGAPAGGARLLIWTSPALSSGLAFFEVRIS
jgi:hypothetical protein